MNSPRIVVVGGGAGGLELVTRLGHKLGRRNRAEIVLVDRSPTHIWKPLLHEVAVGALDTDLDEVSYQGHSRSHGYRFQLGSLAGLDKEARQITLAPIHDEKGRVVLAERTLDYDYLVLALGSVSNDFGTPGVADHCFFLDSPEQAEAFRRAMLNTFLRYSDPQQRTYSHLTIAIVGGGATGVELSAELFNATQMLNSYNYTQVDSRQLKIHLIEAAPRILPALPERIGKAAAAELEKLGVEIHVGTRITRADERGFETADNERIDADLTVWAAGVRGPEILSQLGLSTRPNHQVNVHQTMQSIDDERIFALGDCAACPQPEERFVPPRAQAAHQMASQLYKNLLATLNGQPLQDFHYRDMGSLISLARFDAVGNLMNGTSARALFIEGKLAKLFYASLYRMHQRAVYGTFRTVMKVMVDRIHIWLRPRMKLH